MICLNDSRGRLPHPKCLCSISLLFFPLQPYSSPTPASFNSEIVLLCGWHNKLWSISSVCVCVWGLRLEAVHIISTKHCILAGRHRDRTINITWYSCRGGNWRIHGLMDVQTTTVIRAFKLADAFCVCFWYSEQKPGIQMPLASNCCVECFLLSSGLFWIFEHIFVYSRVLHSKFVTLDWFCKNVQYVIQYIPKPHNHQGTACFFTVLKPQNSWQSIRDRCVCQRSEESLLADIMAN